MNIVSFDSFIRSHINRSVQDIENIDNYEISYIIKKETIMVYLFNRNTQEICYSSGLTHLLLVRQYLKNMVNQLINEDEDDKED